MKNILLSALLAVGLVATTIGHASAETATPESQTSAKFYCGTAKDPSSNDRELPATLFTSAEVPEPRASILVANSLLKSDVKLFRPNFRLHSLMRDAIT
jgi:hypothetical protein